MSIDLRALNLDDLGGVHDLIRAAEVVDQAAFATQVGELEQILGGPHIDLARDTRLALLDGVPVGYAYVDHKPSGERLERAHLFGEVHPDHRRRGVGSTLFGWQLGRARELLESYEHELPRYIRTDQRGNRTDALALYERFGLRVVRFNDELIRPIDPPMDAQPIGGLTIERWDETRNEEVRQVKNTAFADHWGSTPTDGATWTHWLSESTVRLDLSMIALHDGSVVGYSLNDHYPEDEAVTGRRDGWISSLGVLREHRGKGVASALIAASVERFRQVGFTHVMLAVDTENPSGAYALYERLGFEPSERTVTHEIEVPRRA